MKSATMLLTLCTTLVPAAAALADSDGYFCTGTGYLAYETRWVGETRSHVVQIIRFGEEIGFELVEPIELEDFQTHGMTCGKNFIRVRGGSGPAHYVDISDIRHPTVVTGKTPYGVTSDGHHGNLGHWSKESVLDLSAGDAGGRFQLAMLKASIPSKHGVEHFSLTELIQRSSRERILRRHHLFTGIFLETID